MIICPLGYWYFVCFFCLMMPSISVISPTRPTNIKSATSNLLSLPSKGVAFRLEPTVLMAETHSKVIASRDSPGSRILMMKTDTNSTPNDITTVALERRIESCDNSRPNTSTRSVPRNTATRFSVHFDTACGGLRTAANPHKNKVEQ